MEFLYQFGDLLFVLVLLALGFVVGRLLESRHYQSILAREKELIRLPAIPTRIPPVTQPYHEQQLVYGNTVISVDYFKRFLAGLRNIFGGRVTPTKACWTAPAGSRSCA